jgi:hypothetical protein
MLAIASMWLSGNDNVDDVKEDVKWDYSKDATNSEFIYCLAETVFIYSRI